jgi:hypothetical protein
VTGTVTAFQSEKETCSLPLTGGLKFPFFFLAFFSLFFFSEGRGFGGGFSFFFPFFLYVVHAARAVESRTKLRQNNTMGKCMLGKKRMRYIEKHNLELELESGRRLCSRCGEREVYQDTKTMDWCEPCLWNHVKEENLEISDLR